MNMADTLVRVRDLRVHYPLFKGFVQRLLGGGARFVHALDGISFRVNRGEVFGLVGESGCGKSTTGRALLGLTPITAGEILLDFPASGGTPIFIRPRELKIACAVWWGLAAAFLANAAAFALTRESGLPLGLMATVGDVYVPALAAMGALQVSLGLAIWTMRPWSRRPARFVATLGALLGFFALPWGLVYAGIEVGVLVYLGTPDPVGLLRRRGRLIPASRFRLDEKGILEGEPDDREGSAFERWFVGPRVVKTTGFSWVLKQLRGKVQMVYQDPHAALSPALTIGELLRHAIEAHVLTVDGSTGRSRGRAEEIDQEALRLLDEVGLRPPDQFFGKLATDISGGQKQRVVIARALAPQPLLLIADEPVAMLDMSIRAKILELLLDLRQKYGLTYVFITHDLATAKLVCDRIAIMYLGRIVEMGESTQIYADPKHPYTRALLQAIPIPDPRRRARKEIPKGEVPDAVFPPAGCRFHPRCPVALSTCGWEGRDFVEYLEERRIDPARMKEEEATLGPLGIWRTDGPLATRPVREGSAGVLLTRIHEVLAEAPEPLRDAVETVGVSSGRLFVRFRPPAPLEPKEVAGRVVECLLY
jgi:peptide/nickel transport system ATP-binding protein